MTYDSPTNPSSIICSALLDILPAPCHTDCPPLLGPLSSLTDFLRLPLHLLFSAHLHRFHQASVCSSASEAGFTTKQTGQKSEQASIMIDFRSHGLLLGLIAFIALAQPAAAFGAGNIASISKIEGQNC